MKNRLRVFLIFIILSILISLGVNPVFANNKENEEWRGFHMRFGSHTEVEPFKRVIKDALVPLGVNVIILEVNYYFQFESHPELSEGTLTKEDIREISKLCKDNGIRLIPLFEFLGHQGWKDGRNNLLRIYPEFDESPGSTDIYTPAWCPLHPDINEIIFDLIDELITAFEADAFHVGMDEVFEIAKCSRCKDKDPAELFAKAVNEYHDYLVKEKGLEMLMWADRLIDKRSTPYSAWEADTIGIFSAIEMIPTDIILCDWHYNSHKKYPSVPYFLDKGFRVWPATWNSAMAARDFMNYAEEIAGDNERMLGMLVTGWNATGQSILAALLNEGEYDLSDDPGRIKDIAMTLKYVMKRFKAQYNL